MTSDPSIPILYSLFTGKRLTKGQETLLQKEMFAVLQKASENRLEFHFLQTIKKRYPSLFTSSDLEGLLEEGNIKRKDLNTSLRRIYPFLKDKQYVLFKTIYPFPVITSDIDVLFFDKKSYDGFVGEMVSYGYSYVADGKLKGSLVKEGCVKCEPHLDISWYGFRFIPKGFIKKNLERISIDGATFFVPGKNAAYLITAAHIIFDCNYLSLRDYLLLSGIKHDTHAFEECLDHAERYGWRHAFEYAITLIRSGNRGFPFWIPFVRECQFFAQKIIFGHSTSNSNVPIASIMTAFLYYWWKRLRSKFSRRIYRNSWLY